MILSDAQVVRALAVASTCGWKILTRDGHEHLEGGGSDSSADKAEQASCGGLTRVAGSAKLETMNALRDRVVEVLTPDTVRRLAAEASSRGLAASSFPADLVALLLLCAGPLPVVDPYDSWQDVLDAMRATRAKVES
jgi:hypothetical protein